MVRFVSLFVLLAGLSALLGFASQGGAAAPYRVQDAPTTFDTPVAVVSTPLVAELIAPCASHGTDEDNNGCQGKVLALPSLSIPFDPTGFPPRVAFRSEALVTAPIAVHLRPPKRAA